MVVARRASSPELLRAGVDCADMVLRGIAMLLMSCGEMFWYFVETVQDIHKTVKGVEGRKREVWVDDLLVLQDHRSEGGRSSSYLIL